VGSAKRGFVLGKFHLGGQGYRKNQVNFQNLNLEMRKLFIGSVSLILHRCQKPIHLGQGREQHRNLR